MNPPFVIWMGRQPLKKKNTSGRRFRLVYCGPPRANRPDDAPFACEERTGMTHMKRLNWEFPHRADAMQEAIWALSHALGQILMVDPTKLVFSHPIHCELNMAVIEGRESRGCDCNGPAEPPDQGELVTPPCNVCGGKLGWYEEDVYVGCNGCPEGRAEIARIREAQQSSARICDEKTEKLKAELDDWKRQQQEKQGQ